MIRVAIRAASSVTQAGLERLLHDDPEIALMPEEGMPGGGAEADVVVAEADVLEDFSSNLLPGPSPGPAVILLVDDVADAPVAQLLRAGVKGVLPLTSGAAEILAAIHGAAEGLVVLDAALVEILSSSAGLPAGASDFVESLTGREAEVLRLLAEGLSNKDIAICLNISEHTAKFHVASILGKLGATTRTEAVTLGIRHGLIMI